MKKAVFAILLSTAAIVAGPVACSKGDKAEAGYTVGTDLGISKSAMDTSVKPGDDFYAYANGNWDRTTEIPADRSSIGAFYVAFLETEIVDEDEEAAVDSAQYGEKAGHARKRLLRHLDDRYPAEMFRLSGADGRA